MVNFAPNDCGIRARANLKTSDTIIVDIISFIITLKYENYILLLADKGLATRIRRLFW